MAYAKVLGKLGGIPVGTNEFNQHTLTEAWEFLNSRHGNSKSPSSR
jgi:hypothetical protein